MFRKNSDVHTYATRQSSKMHLLNPRTVLAHKSIRHNGPDVWNALPDDTQNMRTIHSFKKAVKRLLISKM